MTIPRMTPDSGADESGHRWHSLLGPLPPKVAPLRQPVAAALAGWEQLVLHLTAGAAGVRTILVVLDASGALLSASDAVLYRSDSTMLQMSVGGRFEPDGSFHGTRWHSVAVERGNGDEPEWESTPSSPSEEDAEALRALVTEIIQRSEPSARSRESGT